MKPLCLLPGSSSGNHIVKTFSRGCQGRLEYVKKYLNEPLPQNDIITWGILRGTDIILKRCVEKSHPFYYIDHAYFHSGHQKNPRRYRVSKNSFQAGKIEKRPDDRWNKLQIKIEPWRKGGRHILVCPPTEPVEYFFNQFDWLNRTLNTLKNFTDRPIVVRQKPNQIKIKLDNGYAEPDRTNNKSVLKHTIPSLDEQFEDAFAVVAFHSNVAVEAVCKGYPVFVSEHSAAATVGLTDFSKIETPIMPNREPWLYHLSYCQFTLEEMLSGHAWEIVSQE